MTLQIDPKMPEEIQHFGCYFMSLVRMTELINDEVFETERIVKLFEELKASGAIGKDSYIAKPDTVLLEAARYISGRSAVQVGVVIGQANFWSWVGAWIVLQGTTEHGSTHFRLADSYGIEKYDPYPGTKIIREDRKVIYMERGRV